MKIHTSQFKEDIKTIGKQLDSKITFEIDGVTQILTSEDLNGVTPTFQGAILKSVMKELDIDSNVDIPIGTEINYKFGVKLEGNFEYLDYGNYIVYSSEKQEDISSYKIICYDKMLNSMKQNEALGITYPLSVRDYINALCTKIGLEFKNKNDEFANFDRILDKELYAGLDYTYRDIFDELAQVTASTICLDKNDKVEIRYISNTSVDTIDENFLKDINVNFGEKFGPINSIVLSRSAESDNVYLQDEKSIEQNGLCEIKIKDNQIMNWNDRSDYLPDILEKLNGLEYYLNDFASTGIAYLDLCDRYNINVFNNTYSCVMFNDEMKVTQGLEEDIHTDMPKETETDYTKADKTDRRINNVSLIVDKQGQRIDALAEKVQDISNTIKGSGVITLTDCSKTPLYKLVITGDDSLLFPSSKTYPSASTFTKNSWLYVNKGESDEKIYDLKFTALRTLGNVKDEYILENTKAILIKRIGLNDNSEKYVLDEPIEIDMGTLTINLKEGTNTLQMPSFPLFNLETTYLLKNDYTETFASTAYVNSEIEVTSDNILLESKSYTDKATEGDELISRINLDSTGNVKIEASKIIDLTGTDINLTGDNVTINSTNFSVDKDGKITSTAGDIAGFEITSNLFEKSINGIYDYNNFDLNLVSQIIMSRIYGDSHIVNVLDANNSGGLTASDYMTIKNIMNGTATNNKNVSGYFKIQSDNPKRCLIVTDENGNEVTSIGVGGLNSTYISTNNIVCGYPGNNASDFVGTTINGSTGNITCNSLTQTSLKTHKKDFEKYSNALKELENIDIYKYHLLNEEENSKKHLGFVIGKDFNYSEIVTSSDNQGVDNYSFTSLCFQMIKEQQEIINKLEKRVDDLENKLKSVIIERESDK